MSENFSNNKSNEEIKKEVSELRKSIEFTQNKLEEKVSNAENKLANVEHQIEEIYEHQIDTRETWENCKEKLQEVLLEKDKRQNNNNGQ